MSETKVSELASLFIPVHGKNLVLPNVSVAELIPYKAPDASEHKENWILGVITWRNLKLPLVSFEKINGDTSEFANAAHVRIAIVNSTTGHRELPFFAMLVQGIPRLVRVTEDDITGKESELPAEAMKVNVQGEPAIIPDLKMIEERLIAA